MCQAVSTGISLNATRPAQPISQPLREKQLPPFSKMTLVVNFKSGIFLGNSRTLIMDKHLLLTTAKLMTI